MDEQAAMKVWWEIQHTSGNVDYLTNTPGKQIWEFLQVQDRIKAESRILNVGVGTGRCTRDLKEAGVRIVHVLDVVQEALDKVSEIAWGYLHPGNLPTKTYDLVLSHLVSQHMSNDTLVHHFKHYRRSLKTHGRVAIQFMDCPGSREQTIEAQRIGMVARTPETVITLAASAGLSCLHTVPPRRFGSTGNVPNAIWYGVHLSAYP